MERKIEVIETAIPRGRTLRIQDGKGFDLRVAAGCLWVTQHGDTTDHVLEAGESFRATRDGDTLVHAFTDVMLRIACPVGASATRVTLHGGCRSVGASVLRAMLAEWLQEIRGWTVAGARERTARAG